MAALTQAQQRIHDAALRLFAETGITQVNVKELAEAAGLARGTIYNNLENPDHLFEDVAAQLASDMNLRANESFVEVSDPAMRLALGIRLYTRRTHDEPLWGRFLTRFAFSNLALQQVWRGQPYADLAQGVQSGRYHLRPEQLPSAIAMVASSTLGAMFLVLDGVKTWREAGSDAAELVLVALGVSRAEARELSTSPLPDLRASRHR